MFRFSQLMDDFEISERDCPKCGNQLAERRCNSCEDGEIDLDDPLWPDVVKCDTCNGTGHEVWCRACGWDVTYSQFLNPQCEAEWLAKQKAESNEEVLR